MAQSKSSLPSVRADIRPTGSRGAHCKAWSVGLKGYSALDLAETDAVTCTGVDLLAFMAQGSSCVIC